MQALAQAQAIATASPLALGSEQSSLVVPQVLPGAGNSVLLAAVRLPDSSITPTDQTPTHIGDERALFTPTFKLKALEVLPARMYFSSVTEVSQRFESNVLSNASNPKRDYVFRVLPNVTLGYTILPRTNVYANYFMIKDVFACTPLLNRSTFHSISGGISHDLPLDRKSNLQLNFQARQLFQAVNLQQADLLPGITYTRALTPNAIGFFNTQLQMRSRNLFQGATREIDPFYTLGLVVRKRQWTLSSSATLVNNFRNDSAIPPVSNKAIIGSIDLSRPVSQRRLPGLDAFMRAEPIWNWGSHRAPGLSGFDFRLFSGFRYSFSKPSIAPQMERLKKQLKLLESNAQPTGAGS
ncbi:MAG: hypothetical protein IPM93_17990 [Candidatus Obscuribacter sp.]|nr:hypothetical protein [Candidatus Obscuribacter sp.]